MNVEPFNELKEEMGQFHFYCDIFFCGSSFLISMRYNLRYHFTLNMMSLSDYIDLDPLRFGLREKSTTFRSKEIVLSLHEHV